VDTFTIGRLAEAAGVNVETVRYYERRGLLEQPPRPGQGYRQYTDADLWRLRFIRRGKDLGFTLAEVADLLGPDGERSSEAVRRAARAKIDLLDTRLAELAATRVRLEQLTELCERGDGTDCQSLQLG
jgi:MerR family mercuric resistance operon transcriptional regulator